MARSFYEIDAYSPSSASYRLLPFKFLKLSGSQELVVNEAGEYLTLPSGTVRDIVNRRVAKDSELYRTLKSKQILFDDTSESLLDLLATKYRTKTSFIDGFTKLHIFVVTLRCDHSCHYCQVSRQTTDKSKYDMSTETALAALEMMFQSPSNDLTLEFQGGEPFLAFDVIRNTVPVAKRRAKELGRNLRLVVTTNLAQVADDDLAFCRDEEIYISTSLDGPAFLHNANRPRPGGNSYELAVANIGKAREVVGYDRVSALMTTTQLSLEHPIEIIDEYVRLGFHSIFLRPISPYGFALKSAKKTGYDIERFLCFYKTGFQHILEINKKGYSLSEAYAKILLTKMLTPFGTGYVDLQSPAGAGINVLVYNYDGKVYATDESRMLAEMGDHAFHLGTIGQDTHKDLFTSQNFINLASASCNQALPGCSDCALQTYCGADPVYHHATQGYSVGHRPSSGFCRRNMDVIKYLFNLLNEADTDLQRIFFSWIRSCGVDEIKRECPS